MQIEKIGHLPDCNLFKIMVYGVIVADFHEEPSNSN